MIDMSSMLITSHPRTVRDAIARHRRGLDENPTLYLEEQISPSRDRTLAAAAAYLGASENEIALTDSTTMGLGLLYSGFVLRPGEEFLATDHGYYSSLEAIRLSASRTGAKVRSVQVYRHGAQTSPEELAEKVTSAIGSKTRVVAVTWVHSSTGLKMPVRLIADRIAQINQRRSRRERVYLCVDGVHGFGIENVQMPDLGCDFFAAGCHKWLFGPRGTGVLYGKSDAWPVLTPTVPTFRNSDVRRAWIAGADPSGPTDASRMQPGGFKAFEHMWALAEAFQFHQEIGKQKVEERTHALATQLKEGLAAMDHVTLYTPMSTDLSSGIVCFDIAGRAPAAVIQSLRERKVVGTTTPYAPTYARLTPSIRNTPDEIEATLRAIRDLA
jgi:isopenicillin-N epimerase